jgi:rhomboid-like protein
MENVWSTIASRAACAPGSRARPLLELFNGYARCQTRCKASLSQSWHAQRLATEVRRAQTRYSAPAQGRLFATTPTCWAARSKKPRRPASKPLNAVKPTEAIAPASQVEPAPTVASHTEGLPPEEDGEGTITWRDYDPEGGMPLPGGELPQPEINAVFGGEQVEADAGNYILSVLQWRRLSGALIDSGLDFPKRSGVTREQALQGLQYVRSLDPGFDERAAGQRWAVEESLRLQEELQQRAISLGLYKKDPEYYEGEEADQGTPEGRERTGESVLRTHREEREAQYDQEQAEAKAKAEREELAALHTQRGPLELSAGVQPSVDIAKIGSKGITIGAGPRSAWLTAPVERKPWVKYYEEQANVLKDNVFPSLSIIQRLAPALLAVCGIVAFSLFLATNYTPPPTSARLWPDTAPAVSTMTAITILLGTTFLLSRLPPFWPFLNKYLTLVPAYPRAITPLTAILRHDTLYHLAINLAVIWSFGLTLHQDVGRGTFLALFMSCGAVGGFVSLTAHVLKREWAAYIFGASTSALGVAAATCTVRPQGTLEVRGLGWELPFAAWVMLAGFLGVEIVALRRGLQIGVDHWGHLGGLLSGVAGGLWVRRQAATEVLGEEATVQASAPVPASAKAP